MNDFVIYRKVFPLVRFLISVSVSFLVYFYIFY